MTVGAVLARPKWMALAILIAVLVPTAMRLGLWQLDRLAERRETNAIWEHRLAADPVPWEVLFSNASALDDEELRYLRVTVTGEFQHGQMLVLNRTQNETSGHYVVTPFLTVGGETLLVVRGWVPFEVRDPADVAILPPAGEVTVEALTVPPEHDPASVAVTSDGLVRYLDLEVIGAHVDASLGRVYLQQTSPGPARYPAVIPLPDTEDEGSHFSYVIQWFSFAVIGLVGFAALVRREALKHAP